MCRLKHLVLEVCSGLPCTYVCPLVTMHINHKPSPFYGCVEEQSIMWKNAGYIYIHHKCSHYVISPLPTPPPPLDTHTLALHNRAAHCLQTVQSWWSWNSYWRLETHCDWWKHMHHPLTNSSQLYSGTYTGSLTATSATYSVHTSIKIWLHSQKQQDLCSKLFSFDSIVPAFLLWKLYHKCPQGMNSIIKF